MRNFPDLVLICFWDVIRTVKIIRFKKDSSESIVSPTQHSIILISITFHQHQINISEKQIPSVWYFGAITAGGKINLEVLIELIEVTPPQQCLAHQSVCTLLSWKNSRGRRPHSFSSEFLPKFSPIGEIFGELKKLVNFWVTKMSPIPSNFEGFSCHQFWWKQDHQRWGYSTVERFASSG